jgi:glycosyltransferase involved in cell wall biosynthesis
MKEKIRVLHIITRLDKGGSADNTLLSVLGLNKEVFKVDLLSGRTNFPSPKLTQLKEQNLIQYKEIGQLVRAIQPFKDISALSQLYQYIKKGRYDIVHTHSSKAGLLGRLAARMAGVKHIIHTPHGHIFYGYYGRGLSFMFIILERWAARYTEKIITLTNAGKEEHIQYKIAPAHKFITIHSGLELGSLQPSDTKNDVAKEFNIDKSDKLIGTVARLVPIKGHEFLLKAAPLVLQHYPNTTFLLIGDGPLRKKLENLAQQLNFFDKIVFSGMREDIPRLLNAIDIFVLPSLNEGMGRVLIEAMALAKPIVATRVGGVPDVIEDGSSGLLVPSADPDALANAICTIMKNPSLAARLASHAVTRSQKFSHTEMIRQLENLYKSVMSSK